MILRVKIHSRMRFDLINVPLGVLFIVLTAGLVPAAHAEIFKCKDEYGNVAYLQTPCPVEKVEEPAVTDDAEAPIVEATQREEVVESSPEPQPSEAQIPPSRRPDEWLDVCKKRYRDQIDEIDAEIRTAFSPTLGDEYKARLKLLTRQLRACG